MGFGKFFEMMALGAMTGANMQIDTNMLREQMRDKRDRISRDIGLVGEVLTDGVFLILAAPRVSAEDLKKLADAADTSLTKKDLAAVTGALSEVTAQQTERTAWRNLIGRGIKLVGERITYWILNDSDINNYAAMAQMMNSRTQAAQTAQAVQAALPPALQRYDQVPGARPAQVNISASGARPMSPMQAPTFRLGAPSSGATSFNAPAPRRANDEVDGIVLTFG